MTIRHVQLEGIDCIDGHGQHMRMQVCTAVTLGLRGIMGPRLNDVHLQVFAGLDGTDSES